jgi:hypothetical protein
MTAGGTRTGRPCTGRGDLGGHLLGGFRPT